MINLCIIALYVYSIFGCGLSIITNITLIKQSLFENYRYSLRGIYVVQTYQCIKIGFCKAGRL